MVEQNWENEEQTAGKILKEAREAARLSQNEIADRLRLDSKIIAALEADNYTTIPGQLYVQGYIKSYCRLLGLAEEEVLARQQSSEVITHGLLPDDIDYFASDKQKSASKIGIILVAVVGILILTIISFFDKNEISTASEDLNVVDKNKTEVKVTDSAEISANTGEQQAEESNSVIQDENPIQEDKIVAPITATEEQPQMVVEEARKFDGLKIYYVADSWTEIHDATGKRIVFGMVKKDEILELTGKQPFSVLIGQASSVKVEFKGKEFNHNRFARNGMARFVVGSALEN